MKPTRWHYFMAGNWSIRIWFAVVIALCASVMIWAAHVSLELLNDWVVAACLAVVVLLSVPLGWFVSVLLGWFVLGPIYLGRGCKNGGPFQVGDRVRVLVGPHRDRVTTVYSEWQHDSVRVALGEQEQREFEDIFCPHQLLREPPDKSLPDAESPARGPSSSVP